MFVQSWVEVKEPMKLKTRNKIGIYIFFWLILFLAVTNPLLGGINVYYSSKQITASAPTLPDGINLQGSLIVNQLTQQVTATNQTSGQQVQAYQTTVSVFNFGALLLLLSPLVLYLFFELKPKADTDQPKNPRARKKQTKDAEAGIDSD